MKRILLTVVCSVLVQLTFAQVQQGTWSATGSLGYSKNDGKSDNGNYTTENRNYLIRPGIGYFVADNLEVGLAGGFRYYEQETRYSNPAGPNGFNYNEIKNISTGVYARAYKFLVNNLAVYGQADANYNRSSVIYTQTYTSFSRYEVENKTETDYLSAAIRPGIAFFMSEKISLNATYGALSYSRNNEEQQRKQMIFGETSTKENSSDRSELELNLGSSSFSLGLSFYF